MKYVELSESNSTIAFSKDAVQAMKLKEGSGLLIFGIKGQMAFGIQERKKVDFDKMRLAFCQKPTRFSKKLIAVTDQPSPAHILWKLGIDAPDAKLPLKEWINEQGQVIYYIGTWKN